MHAIQARVSKTSEKVQEMSQFSEQIGAILDAIQEIASQTNLLALNAAIEAAHAGKFGAGFAVVAEEVRKLADRSSVSAKQIAQLIKAIQTTAGEAVAAMQASSEEVDNGVMQAGNSSRALQEIQAAVEAVRRQVQEISAAADKVAQASDELDEVMESVTAVMEANAEAAKRMTMGATQMEFEIESIASISEQNTTAVEEVGAGVEQMTSQVAQVSQAASALSEMAHALMDGVSTFRLGSQAEPTARREASAEEILEALRERVPPPPPAPTVYLGPDRRAGLAKRLEHGEEPQN